MPETPPRRLVVDGLGLDDHHGHEVVADVGFSVDSGEVLALIGESGCGKTSVALALLGYARPGMRIVAGSVLVDGLDLLALSPKELRRHRGPTVALVPQSPTSSLNPRLRVGDQVAEVLRVHRVRADEARARVRDAFDRVTLPSDDAFLRRHPFELSGGQLQRVAIAMAIVGRPKVVVLDEPTTGLDVTTQRKILELLSDIAASTQSSFVYVSHDLAVVEGLANTIAVMYAGRVVESGARGDVFGSPAHPYTRLLLRSVPRRLARQRLIGIAGVAPAPGHRPDGCTFSPRCPLCVPACQEAEPDLDPIGAGHRVRCIRASESLEVAHAVPRPVAQAVHPDRPLLEVSDVIASYRAHARTIPVLQGISLAIGADECLGLVGESGSGKSTLARCIAGLQRSVEGTLTIAGQQLPWDVYRRPRSQRRSIQIVFQNPDRSLNPRETAGTAILRALRLFDRRDGQSESAELRTLLEQVRLPLRALDLYPRDLSGGEKQRVAIARALAPRPDLLICDEVTSALDVSIQAAVVDVLADLKAQGLALLFITHNLPLVASIADRVIVMRGGTIQESGDARRLLEAPEHPYTRELVAAAPELR